MTRLKRLRRALPYIGAILGILVLYRFTRPVLFYIPGDCACTDYSNRVDGFAILNPLRNSAPERAANAFLEDVRGRRQSAFAETQLAGEVVAHPSGLSGWELEFREDQRDTVRLYYRVDNSGLKDPGPFEGEGMVEMKRENGSWKAVSFDATF